MFPQLFERSIKIGNYKKRIQMKHSFISRFLEQFLQKEELDHYYELQDYCLDFITEVTK